VLLADDDDDLREVLALGLRMHGFEVLEVVDGNELCAHLRACLVPPDVIVSDVRMPGMTGLDVLQSARLLDEVPLILMTGAPVSRADVLRSGVATVLAKPFELGDLLQAVGDSIASRRTPSARELA
jgi:DNA-binding response OmpR family regulator